MERKEHKIGEVFERKGKKIKIELDNPSSPCSGCYRKVKGKCNAGPLMRSGELESCADYKRSDRKDIIFKEVKDMKEEKLNKDEHFYILGVPNRGKEVKELLLSKGIITDFKDESYSNEQRCFYNDNGCRFINKISSPLLYDLVTSNWTELKLPYKPKDKELVWAWNDEEYYKVLGIYCLEWNSIYETKCRMCCYSNYKHYEGEYPQWAKDALSKLEE